MRALLSPRLLAPNTLKNRLEDSTYVRIPPTLALYNNKITIVAIVKPKSTFIFKPAFSRLTSIKTIPTNKIIAAINRISFQLDIFPIQINIRQTGNRCFPPCRSLAACPRIFLPGSNGDCLFHIQPANLEARIRIPQNISNVTQLAVIIPINQITLRNCRVPIHGNFLVRCSRLLVHNPFCNLVFQIIYTPAFSANIICFQFYPA